MVGTLVRGIVRLVGAILLERNDEWAVGRAWVEPRYLKLETFAPMIYDSVVGLARGRKLMPSNPSKNCGDRSSVTPNTGHDCEAVAHGAQRSANVTVWGSRAVRARECDKVTEEQECHDRA